MLAWNNETVHQSIQTNRTTQEIAPGFEEIARVITEVLRRLPEAEMDETDHEDAREAAQEVLDEVTQEEPDRGRIRRGMTLLRKLLAPMARGVAAGAQKGVQQWALDATEKLGQLTAAVNRVGG
ncbi:hypothetical protein EFW17_22585 [Halostreptopolyspora alba]|uniref:Uncharacterized protein n=2 Tax=Halostreptopolyspora alba TaxID=2487137 RepID=A0A3N0DYU0_9ACTN|nr:hypothetical protein EFW17_22585 [Nocardiopsaceae bacterium YIM 96095]